MPRPTKKIEAMGRHELITEIFRLRDIEDAAIIALPLIPNINDQCATYKIQEALDAVDALQEKLRK